VAVGLDLRLCREEIEESAGIALDDLRRQDRHPLRERRAVLGFEGIRQLRTAARGRAR
jgi:hypothetical protein